MVDVIVEQPHFLYYNDNDRPTLFYNNDNGRPTFSEYPMVLRILKLNYVLFVCLFELIE